MLRGRCRQCRAWIGLRYPIVEAAIATLWTLCWLRFNSPLLDPSPEMAFPLASALLRLIGSAVLCWLLVALAALDAEHFWLPDLITIPGAMLGFLVAVIQTELVFRHPRDWLQVGWSHLLEILVCAGLVLLIRLVYWIARRQEGMGLGDVKLMALLGAWLGLIGGLESFALAVLGATVFAFAGLALAALRRNAEGWSQIPLPFGTFLCLAALLEVFNPSWLLDRLTGGF